MAKLVDDLQYRLADLKESQVDLVMRLRDRADASVAAAEAVVRHTGLNIRPAPQQCPGHRQPGGNRRAIRSPGLRWPRPE